MTPLDLLFLLTVLITVGALLRVGYQLVCARPGAAKTTFLRLGGYLAAYTTTLIAVSLLSRGETLQIGEARCFDEWCIAGTSALRQPSIGGARARGIFYVVTLRVSSESRGRPQRETDVDTYLLDARGRRFDVSVAGADALQRAGLAGQPVTSVVAPGGSLESRLVFDVALDAAGLGFVKASHSGFPRRLIIGDPESFLHRPTVVRLDTH
jgi:hypothetical protein